MARRSRSQRWFERGAQAVQALAPALPYGYACPICGQIFSLEAIEELTIEHVPPKQLGGKPLVLTCRGCNSKAGHEFDHHAVREAQMTRFFQGTMKDGDSISFVMDLDGYKVRGDVANTGYGRQIVGQMELLGPPLPPEPTITLTGFTNQWCTRGFKADRAALSWVRAAYLVAFAALGYSYVMKDGLDVIRQALVSSDDDSPRIPYVYLDDALGTERSLFVASRPVERLCVIVQFGKRLIVLPGLDGRTGFYDDLALEGYRDALFDPIDQVVGKIVDWPKEPMHYLDYER